MTATINTSSGVKTVTNTINITIKPDCAGNSFVDKAITNMAIVVTGTQTQDVWFTDVTGISYGNEAYCGPRTYTFVPALQSYLTLNAAQNTLTLNTANQADVGLYNFAMTVAFTNYPLVKITKNFQVTIECNL
jgi:hypothetical protein